MTAGIPPASWKFCTLGAAAGLNLARYGGAPAEFPELLHVDFTVRLIRDGRNVQGDVGGSSNRSNGANGVFDALFVDDFPGSDAFF